MTSLIRQGTLYKIERRLIKSDIASCWVYNPTILAGGALGVELEAEKLARDHGLTVQVIIPPCHPQSKTVPPLTITQLAEAIPI